MHNVENFYNYFCLCLTFKHIVFIEKLLFLFTDKHIPTHNVENEINCFIDKMSRIEPNH